MSVSYDRRIAVIDRVTSAFAEEIDRHDADAAIPWPLWPTVGAVIDHLGRNHQWAAEIVRTGEPVDRSTLSRAPATGVRQWYDGCRGRLLSALAETPPDRPCWVVGGRNGGTAGVWARRMVFESVKHLIDVRASGGGTRHPAPELDAADYADGVDELFAEFLPRSRPTLEPLPGPLTLTATDVDRRWTIADDWRVTDEERDGTRVRASAGDIALLVWQRADPSDPRFHVDGDAATVAAFAVAPVHP